MGQSHASSFCVVGQFLGYELKGHKIHRVHLRREGNEYRFKLSSGARDDLLRAALDGNLKIGDWVQVSGLKEVDRKKELKLKAHALTRCAAPKKKSKDELTSQPKPTKVLVCQKSGCCKRGGKAVMKQLQKVIDDRQLDGQVCVKATGCMGKCSKGPVMVIDKTPYRQVKAKKVAGMIEHHVGDKGDRA